MSDSINTDLGLAMTGGGARAAYQVGVLRYICKQYPDFHPPVLTGVSAGRSMPCTWPLTREASPMRSSTSRASGRG